MYGYIPVQIDLDDIEKGLLICLKRVRMNDLFLLNNVEVGDKVTDPDGNTVTWTPDMRDEVTAGIQEIERIIATLVGR